MPHKLNVKQVCFQKLMETELIAILCIYWIKFSVVLRGLQPLYSVKVQHGEDVYADLFKKSYFSPLSW